MRDRIYLHLVWTTRGRRPLINARVAGFLGPLLRNIARQEEAHILEIGIVATHVHILVRVRPTTRLPRLLQRLKGGSARMATAELELPLGRTLRWEAGYSAQSVGYRSLDAVRAYLRNQPGHHPQDAIPGWAGDQAEYEPEIDREMREAGYCRDAIDRLRLPPHPN